MSGLRRTSSTWNLSSPIESSEVDDSPSSLRPIQDSLSGGMQGISMQAAPTAHSLGAIRAEMTNHHPEFAAFSTALAPTSSTPHGDSFLIQEGHFSIADVAGVPETRTPRSADIINRAEEAITRLGDELNPELLHSLQTDVQYLNEIAVTYLSQHDGNNELREAIKNHDANIENIFNNPGKGTYDHEYQSSILTHLREAFELSRGVMEDPSFSLGLHETSASTQQSDARPYAAPESNIHQRGGWEQRDHEGTAFSAQQENEGTAALEEVSDQGSDWGHHAELGSQSQDGGSIAASSDSGHSNTELDELGGIAGHQLQDGAHPVQADHLPEGDVWGQHGGVAIANLPVPPAFINQQDQPPSPASSDSGHTDTELISQED